MDVLERETDLAVRCEPESCGLEELEEQQDQLEVMGSGENKLAISQISPKSSNQGRKNVKANKLVK